MNANMPLKEFWFCFFLFREKEARGLMKREMELRMFFSFRLQAFKKLVAKSASGAGIEDRGEKKQNLRCGDSEKLGK